MLFVSIPSFHTERSKLLNMTKDKFRPKFLEKRRAGLAYFLKLVSLCVCLRFCPDYRKLHFDKSPIHWIPCAQGLYLRLIISTNIFVEFDWRLGATSCGMEPSPYLGVYSRQSKVGVVEVRLMEYLSFIIMGC